MLSYIRGFFCLKYDKYISHGKKINCYYVYIYCLVLKNNGYQLEFCSNVKYRIVGNAKYLTGNIAIIRKLEKMFKSYEV